MIEIFFAVLAGILTVGAPCILPLLPILLGASVGQTSKTRPLFIVLGFIVSFSLTGLFLSFVITRFMISPDNLRNGAVVGLGIFGLVMLWPTPFEKLTGHLSGLIGKASSTAKNSGSGNFGGFVLGLILGLLWTPCAGPVLGTILTLIATQSDLVRAGYLLVAYAIGAGLPMLAIAYGGQWLTTKVRALTPYLSTTQKIFGLLIILLAIGIFLDYDLKLQSWILDHLPTDFLAY